MTIFEVAGCFLSLVVGLALVIFRFWWFIDELDDEPYNPWDKDGNLKK